MKTASIRLFVITLLALAAFAAAAQPVRIGYINVQRIERESKRPQRDAERLKREFAAREQEVRELRAKVLAMQSEIDNLKPGTPAAEREKKQRAFETFAQNFEQIRRNFLEDVDRRRAEERQKFIRDVVAAVGRIAEARKLDLVFENAVYASRSIDITDEVIKALDSGQTAK